MRGRPGAPGAQYVLVGRVGAALRTAEERGPGLHQASAAGQEVDHVRRPAHPSRGDQRHEGSPSARGQQGPDGPVLVGAVVVGQAGPVRPCLAALQAQGVGSHPEGGRRLLGRRGRQHHQRPSRLQ